MNWNAGMLTAGSREVCRCERGTKGCENNLMKAPRPGCVCEVCERGCCFVSASHILSVSIETRVQIQESVRGKDVFVIQTMSK